MSWPSFRLAGIRANPPEKRRSRLCPEKVAWMMLKTTSRRSPFLKAPYRTSSELKRLARTAKIFSEMIRKRDASRGQTGYKWLCFHPWLPSLSDCSAMTKRLRRRCNFAGERHGRRSNPPFERSSSARCTAMPVLIYFRQGSSNKHDLGKPEEWPQPRGFLHQE